MFSEIKMKRQVMSCTVTETVHDDGIMNIEHKNQQGRDMRTAEIALYCLRIRGELSAKPKYKYK
jgi:hypothetical protein